VVDDRKLAVLRAIVHDYVATHEPVGSKAIVERHGLGVSPATVRNDMAVLEEDGYITQPHTSAGRIPTDKGYRLFVDRLSEVKPLTAAERRAIAAFLDGAVDLDEIVTRSVRLLAQITRQVAVVQYPSLRRSRVRHVELVPLTTTRLLVVVITDTGRVDQRVVDLAAPVEDALLGELRSRLNVAAVDRQSSAALVELEQLPTAFTGADRAIVSTVLTVIAELLASQHEERFAVAGTPNLTAYGHEFETSVGPLLEALEEHVVLLRLLGEASSPSALTVRIGHENPPELAAASLVSTAYGAREEALGTLGVLGPTAMDYPSTIAAVRAVARYLSRAFGE